MEYTLSPCERHSKIYIETNRAMSISYRNFHLLCDDSSGVRDGDDLR